jgi:hypothetical protein
MGVRSLDQPVFSYIKIPYTNPTSGTHRIYATVCQTNVIYIYRCGEENTDRNTAFNTAYRALGYISKVGVTVNMPKLKSRTFASVYRNAMITKEATYFNR